MRPVNSGKSFCTVQYLIGFAPFAPVERVLEFRVSIAQRHAQWQKGTPQSIQREAWSFAVVAVQCLFQFG